jgi:hypothetical protein
MPMSVEKMQEVLKRDLVNLKKVLAKLEERKEQVTAEANSTLAAIDKDIKNITSDIELKEEALKE